MSSYPWSAPSAAPSPFCEDAVPGFILEPANTWSNIGFIVAGIAILRGSSTAPSLIRRFGFVCMLVGAGSAAFHATRTYLGGLLDSAGMQGAAAFIIAANVRLLFPSTDDDAAARNDARTFWSIAAVGIALSIAFEQHGRTVFALEIVIAAAMQLALLWRDPLVRAHRWLLGSWTTFVTAYVMWWLDAHRYAVACNSSAHIVNGHAAWHLLLAASLFCIQRFHAEASMWMPRTTGTASGR